MKINDFAVEWWKGLRHHLQKQRAMEHQLKQKLKGTLVVPVGLFLILIPYSLLLGWNVLTLLGFWFIITPILAIYLPERITNQKDHLFKSMVGLVLFYAIMVFMIYEHYDTDYFKVMMVSLMVNLIVVSVVTWPRKLEAKTS